MKVNKWTLGLAAVGLVTIPVTMQAEEKMSAVNTLLTGTTISGYVDTSAQWQVGSGGTIARGGTPPAYAFNTANKQDGFNLNAVNVVIEKPLDAQDNWAAGYKVDMIYGQNAALLANNSFGTASGDFGLKQAYVALRAPVGNGIDFKMGTFDTIIGYEVFNAGNNPNFTRSWGYTMEPTQHTGLLASYQFCKEFGIAAGVANTWSAGINTRSPRAESDKTYMGAVTLSAPDSWGSFAGSTLYAGAVSGFDAVVGAERVNYYAGVTLNTPVKGFKVGASYDYAANPRTSAIANSYYANATALYLSYQATEKLSLHGRAEYATASTILAGGGIPSDVLAITGTVQYDLWANVLSRLEVRWDHSLAGNEGVAKPFNNTDRNALMVAANVIYKF